MLASPESRTRLLPMKVSSHCASGITITFVVTVYEGSWRCTDHMVAPTAISAGTTSNGHHRRTSRIPKVRGLSRLIPVSIGAKVGVYSFRFLDGAFDLFMAVGELRLDGSAEVLHVIRRERPGCELGHTTDVGGDGR